jgi:hypothetical protein
MKLIRSWMGIAALVLVFLLALGACDSPLNSGGDGNGPSDGNPWVFQNASSQNITVYPDNDPPHADQGWASFALPKGESKTVRVNRAYDRIYYKYPITVTAYRVSGENRIRFTD